jgi:hypothetical protein
LELPRADLALEWETRVLPVLQAVARAYSKQPSELGVSTQAIADEVGSDSDMEAIGLLLAELERSRYIEEMMGNDDVTGPAWCRLAEKGLQVTAGWPTSSGAVAFERLIALVDARIADAETDEECSPLVPLAVLDALAVRRTFSACSCPARVTSKAMPPLSGSTRR